MFDVVLIWCKRIVCFEMSKDNWYFFIFDGFRGYFFWLYYINVWKLLNLVDCVVLKNFVLNFYFNIDY